MILNEYSKTAWVNGASPDINKANLDNLEQGVYDVTAKAMELAAYETNAAASATSAAASAAVYTDLAQDVSYLQTYTSNTVLKANTNIYVATTGSDTTGIGSQSLPYATITKALSMIPKNLNGFSANVYVATGVYNEIICAIGFHGGFPQIILNGAITVKNIVVHSCSGFCIASGSLKTLTITDETANGIEVSNSCLYMDYVSIIVSSATNKYGVFVRTNSIFTFKRATLTVNNANVGLIVTEKSSVFIDILAGSGSITGIYGDNGSVISYGTKTIVATTEKTLLNNAKILNDIASKTQPIWINAPLIAPTVNYGNGYQTCQYRKDEFGIVHIRGIVKGGANGTNVFVLPVGYRPALNEVFATSQNSTFGTITVFSNGNVVQVGAGVATSFCFGNISFVGV